MLLLFGSFVYFNDNEDTREVTCRRIGWEGSVYTKVVRMGGRVVISPRTTKRNGKAARTLNWCETQYLKRVTNASTNTKS
jgi:hypothetical protein